MTAYLGLSSSPARVQSISTDRIAVCTAFAYAVGFRTAVELQNDARTFKCILSLKVDRVDPDPGGGYRIEATFTRLLTADELHDLGS
jgi:hypothetical protein